MGAVILYLPLINQEGNVMYYVNVYFNTGEYKCCEGLYSQKDEAYEKLGRVPRHREFVVTVEESPGESLSLDREIMVSTNPC